MFHYGDANCFTDLHYECYTSVSIPQPCDHEVILFTPNAIALVISIVIIRLVGDLVGDLLASDLLKHAAPSVGDLFAGVPIDVVAGLLGASSEC